MSLLDVQRSLVGFARGSSTEFQGCDNLTRAEYEWLKQLQDSPGLQVTQQIQQWWRIARVCASAPLTIELLKRAGLEELIVEYITTEPVRSLFFVAELEQFKCFLQRQIAVDATTHRVIEFEVALKNAYQTSVSGTSASAATEAPQQFHFTQNPIQLFTALLTGTPLPTAVEHHCVIVSPDLPQHWCLAPKVDNLIAKMPNNAEQISPALTS